MTASGSNSWTAITWPRPLSARRSHVIGNLIAFRLNSTGAYGKPNSRLLIRANIVTFALLMGLVSKWQQSGNNTNDIVKTLRKQAKSSTPSSGTTSRNSKQHGNSRTECQLCSPQIGTCFYHSNGLI